MDFLETMIDFISSSIDFLKSSPLDNIIDELNLMGNGFVNEYFGYSKQIAFSFLTISFITSLIMVLITKGDVMAAKLKSSLVTIVFSAAYLKVADLMLNILFQGGDLFSQLWATTFGVEKFVVSLLPITAVAVVATLTTMGTALIVFLVIIFVFLILSKVLNALIYLVLVANIILYPLFIWSNTLPFEPPKKLFTNANLLLLTLIMLKPSQNLVSLVAFNTVLSGGFSIEKYIAPLFAVLILNVVVLPGMAVLGFTKLLNFANS